MDVLAYILAAVLLALALLHVYWAFGGMWPGRDEAELAQIVVGGSVGLRMPSSAACIGVTIALLVASLLVLGAQGLVSLPISTALVHFAVWVQAFVLVARGVVGFFGERLQPAIIGTPFARLNVALYSPLALALGAGTIAIAF